jgi:hypothetical protein
MDFNLWRDARSWELLGRTVVTRTLPDDGLMGVVAHV